MRDAIKRQSVSVWRKFQLTLWLGLWPFLAILHFYPNRDTALRLLIVCALFLLWAGGLWLFWKQRIVRWTCTLIGAFILAVFVLPGRDANAHQMRLHYTEALRTYTGTPYVWGGETQRGIDCSGLLRCAMMDANVRGALRSGNPRLLRTAFSLWWNDCSALALRDEYRDWTQLLFTTPGLNVLDYSRLQPGDIAVTAGGGHCLAYLGEKTWIEADPSALVGDRVIQVKVPTKNAWFSQPMHILRWRQMQD